MYDQIGNFSRVIIESKSSRDGKCRMERKRNRKKSAALDAMKNPPDISTIPLQRCARARICDLHTHNDSAIFPRLLQRLPRLREKSRYTGGVEETRARRHDLS